MRRRDTKVNGRSDAEIGLKLDSIAQRLDGNVRPIVDEIVRLRGDDQANLNASSAIGERSVLARNVWASDWEQGLEHVNITAFPTSSPSPSFERRIEEAILESLAFPSMDDRGTMVPTSYGDTFRWLFQQESDYNHNRVGFHKWLRADTSSIYWITGKPGSGKSTLMKYITQHPSLGHHLRRWAGRLEPLWAGYYFWDAGSNPLQKSRAGMMMTLLYHLLRKKRSLLPTVARRRWTLYSVLGNTLFTAPPWTWEELYETFSRVAAESGRAFRLALFIDGLDEFDGNPADIIAFVKLLNSQYNVKICVASRPWTEFAEALAQSPSLTMQNLTQRDILDFIHGNLKACPAFHERRAVSQVATARLIDDIAKKASGVFLWVALVVRSLVQRLMDGHSMADLHDILESMPQDMMELYTSIWHSIELDKIEISSRLLQIKIASLDIIRLDVRLLWFIEGERLDGREDEQALAAISSLLRRKLMACTKGIMEVSPTGYIEFLHRSAKDWAKQDNVWTTIRSKTPAHFDPSLELLKAANTYIVPHLDPATDQACWGQIVQCLTLASNVVDLPETARQLIKNLDRMNWMLSHSNDPTLYSAGHWSTTKFRQDIQQRCKGSRVENCFVGLAAQFAILPYVRAKVSQKPGLLRTKWRHQQISLLESAIFGWEGDAASPSDSNIYGRIFVVDAESVPPEYKLSRWFCTPQRMEIIRYLLEAGESRKREAYMHDSQPNTVYGRLREWNARSNVMKPLKLVKRRPPDYRQKDRRDSESIEDIEEEPKMWRGSREYWDEVAKLVDDYSSNFVVLWWRRRRLQR